MRLPASILTALLLLTLNTTPAAADTLTATLGQPLKETAHRVDVRLKNGVAMFRVRRTFHNTGKKHEEASLAIRLPFGAAATGLRIRGKKRWFQGELMERDKAAKLYQKLTGLGPHTPRDPALLQWMRTNEIHLQVFPVPPKKQATVEYTLTVPTRYSDGLYTLSYPRHNGAKNLAVPILRIHPGSKAQTRITVNGRSTARAQSVALRQAVIKPLPGGLRRDSDASYTVSSLRIQRRGFVQSVEIRLDIRHTYAGDLYVQLVTPTGERQVLHDQAGGSNANVRKTVKLKLSKKTPLQGRWSLVVSDHAGLDVGQLTAWSVRGKVGKGRFMARATGLPLVLPDAPSGPVDNSQATVRLSPGRIRTLNGRLGRVVAGKRKQLLRVELDTAPRLRPLPKALSVVFVVDASHSMKPAGIRRQLALVRAYLAHVPRARFEVVLYRRTAKRLMGSFARAKTFHTRVKTAQKRGLLLPGNGSNLDEGLAMAAKGLRGRRGTRRIVVFTDNLLRLGWKNRSALRALKRAPRSTITHVVVPEHDDDSVSERRDDKHRLSPIAARNGGVLLRIKSPRTTSHNKLVPVMLGLVRPIRIDQVRVLGLPRGHGLTLPSTLKEGSGLREMVWLKRAPWRLTVRGKIWAKPFRKVIRVDRRFTRATAAFVFSHNQHDDLTRAEMLRVAKLGRVVSPVTSYLAIEPGVRPSRAGIVRRSAVSSDAEDALGCLIGSISSAVRPVSKFKPLMRAHVKRCVALHKPAAGWWVKLRTETTYDEVVNVIPGGKPSAMRRCLVEGAWKVRLSAAFYEEHDAFDFTLP